MMKGQSQFVKCSLISTYVVLVYVPPTINNYLETNTRNVNSYPLSPDMRIFSTNLDFQFFEYYVNDKMLVDKQ